MSAGVESPPLLRRWSLSSLPPSTSIPSDSPGDAILGRDWTGRGTEGTKEAREARDSRQTVGWDSFPQMTSIHLVTYRTPSEYKRSKKRDEMKKMLLACYAVSCCIGAYGLFTYAAFWMK